MEPFPKSVIETLAALRPTIELLEEIRSEVEAAYKDPQRGGPLLFRGKPYMVLGDFMRDLSDWDDQLVWRALSCWLHTRGNLYAQSIKHFVHAFGGLGGHGKQAMNQMTLELVFHALDLNPLAQLELINWVQGRPLLPADEVALAT